MARARATSDPAILDNGGYDRLMTKETSLCHVEHLVGMISNKELSMTQLADGTGVLLDIGTMEVYTLNRTGMRVLNAVATGVSNRCELAGLLVAEFNVDLKTASEDIEAFLSGVSSLFDHSRI